MLFKAGEAGVAAAQEEEATGGTTGMAVETCFEEGEGGTAPTEGTTGRPSPAQTAISPTFMDLLGLTFVKHQQAGRRRLGPPARTRSALVQAFLS